MVERRLAKAEVAGSSPVFRSNYTKVDFKRVKRPLKISIWRHSQVVRHRSAKPLCPGSNPGGASTSQQTTLHTRPSVILPRVLTFALLLLLFRKKARQRFRVKNIRSSLARFFALRLPTTFFAGSGAGRGVRFREKEL